MNNIVEDPKDGEQINSYKPLVVVPASESLNAEIKKENLL
jgi:hypothetical protein